MTRSMQHDPEFTPPFSRVIDLRKHNRNAPRDFAEAATAEERAELATLLDAQEVAKLKVAGQIRPDGARGWRVEAHVTATVMQTCAVSLKPVTTKLNQKVTRRFVAEGGVELLDFDPTIDEELEPLSDFIDIGRIATEATSLGLPDFPRDESADLPELAKDPTDTPSSFAALAALKAQMDQK